MNTTETPKFDWNKPFRTRDGRKAELLRKMNTCSVFPCVVLLIDKSGKEDVERYTESGKLHAGDDSTYHDLVNIPEKRKMWVNVYDEMGIAWNSKKEADSWAQSGRIACVEIEFEFMPGQGL